MIPKIARLALRFLVKFVLQNTLLKISLSKISQIHPHSKIEFKNPHHNYNYIVITIILYSSYLQKQFEWGKKF